MRIILAGCIGRFPVAGHAWITIQYLLGFRSLGHDVYYLEDCGDESWVYDWKEQRLTDDMDYPASFVGRMLEPIGMGGRWIYRTSRASAGMSIDLLMDACHQADLLVVRGAPLPIWRDEYNAPRRRAFIDVDPLFTQVKAARGEPDIAATLDRCEHLFTIAQRIGKADCHIPLLNRTWHTTVSPIFLPAWPVSTQPVVYPFTTVMQWTSYTKVRFGDTTYGNKSHEFPMFTAVARRSDAGFCVAMIGRPPGNVDISGWQIIEGTSISNSLEDYQPFIQQSFGEFSVAKQGYVVSRGGWFSDRSVCYLASGRPVVVQDTGLCDALPLGRGVIVFQTVDEAVEAVRDVQQHYDEHRLAARRVAEAVFSTDRVLPPLLEQALA